MAFTAFGQHMCQVGPGQNIALAAGLNHTGQQGQRTTALRGTRSLADASSDHPVTQGPFGFVIGERELRVLQHYPDRLPIIEKLARQGPGFLMG